MFLTNICLSPPQRLLLAMITISIEIHFTKLYMADLGTRAESLGEGAQAGDVLLFVNQHDSVSHIQTPSRFCVFS